MPRGENKPSILLSKEENEQVFGLIGSKCQSLATTVVKLFTTEGPAHNEWKKKDTGVLCLIKDNSRRSYFFRIFCLYKKTLVWEHEVYIQIEYDNPMPYFHTFEAEEKMTAFNFANVEEATTFRNILIEKIDSRKQKREERRQRSMQASRANCSTLSQYSVSSGGSGGGARVNGVATPTATLPSPTRPAPPVPKARPIGIVINEDLGLDKVDIEEAPQNAPLVDLYGPGVLVRLRSREGYDMDSLPEEDMRSFFNKAAISESQLQDQATRQFIYDFINNHGGSDAVKEELTSKTGSKVSGKEPIPLPAPPSQPPGPRKCPGPLSGKAPIPLPAPPTQPPGPLSGKAPIPLLAPPSQPPGPLSGKAPIPLPAPPSQPPGPPPSSGPPSAPSSPPPSLAAAAPPPAPQSPSPTPPPMVADVEADSSPEDSIRETLSVADPRAELMASILSGSKNLKKVETVAMPAPVSLLSEIRRVKLKAVSREACNAAAERKPEASGLAGALARALQERSRAIHSSDSELSDETTSDGEWDD